MSSRAEIESLRKANEMGFLEDVIMDPVDSFEGGVEIQAQFIAPIDAKRRIRVEVFLFLPMTKDKAEILFSEADYLYNFNRVSIANSYKIRRFVWDQAKMRIKDLEDTRLRADIPPKVLQERAAKNGIKKTWDEPKQGGKRFETDYIGLKHLWKNREQFGSVSGSKNILKNEKFSSSRGDWYTLDAILSSDQTDEFLRIFNTFFHEF